MFTSDEKSSQKSFDKIFCPNSPSCVLKGEGAEIFHDEDISALPSKTDIS